MKIKFGVIGIDKLNRDLKKLGKVPQKHVTAAAKKGMNPVLKAAKADAPEDEGNLKRGIKLSGERSRHKGKKVYRIIFDPSMNDIFQKKNSEGKITGYYPISQEYGFFAKNGRYIPGFSFIHDALISNAKNAGKIIVTHMKSKIDEEIRRAGLK